MFGLFSLQGFRFLLKLLAVIYLKIRRVFLRDFPFALVFRSDEQRLLTSWLVIQVWLRKLFVKRLALAPLAELLANAEANPGRCAGCVQRGAAAPGPGAAGVIAGPISWSASATLARPLRRSSRHSSSPLWPRMWGWG